MKRNHRRCRAAIASPYLAALLCGCESQPLGSEPDEPEAAALPQTHLVVFGAESSAFQAIEKDQVPRVIAGEQAIVDQLPSVLVLSPWDRVSFLNADPRSAAQVYLLTVTNQGHDPEAQSAFEMSELGLISRPILPMRSETMDLAFPGRYPVLVQTEHQSLAGIIEVRIQ